MSPIEWQGLWLMIFALAASLVSAIWLSTPPETMEQTLSEQLNQIKREG